MPKLKKVLKGLSRPKIDESASTARFTLPDGPSPAVHNPSRLKWLLVATPGWGKTEYFMSNPESLLLACEEGHAEIAGAKVIIDCWDGRLANDSLEAYADENGTIHDSFVRVVRNLQKTRKYSFIIIDTVDALVKMLLDYMLARKGAEHASDLGDFGKGWDVAQNTPFRRQLTKILKTGRGIGATTHEQIEEKAFKSGPKIKRETSLPKGIYKQIYAQFDKILHGITGKMPKTEKTRDRMIITEGSEELLAKNRGGILPPAFLVPRKMEARWKQLSDFYTKPDTAEAAFKAFQARGYSLD